MYLDEFEEAERAIIELEAASQAPPGEPGGLLPCNWVRHQLSMFGVEACINVPHGAPASDPTAWQPATAQASEVEERPVY